MRPSGSPPRAPIAVLAALLLAGAAGCSSPDRGPETDVVEVERIDLAAPTDAGGTPTDAGEAPSAPESPATPPAP